MKEVPKVFKNKTNKSFNNNRSIYYSNNNYSDSTDTRTVLQKINNIFSSPNYIYKANVEIMLKDKKIIKRIIGRNKTHIITMDNDLIPIVDILNIKSMKK